MIKKSSPSLQSPPGFNSVAVLATTNQIDTSNNYLDTIIPSSITSHTDKIVSEYACEKASSSSSPSINPVLSHHHMDDYSDDVQDNHVYSSSTPPIASLTSPLFINQSSTSKHQNAFPSYSQTNSLNSPNVSNRGSKKHSNPTESSQISSESSSSTHIALSLHQFINNHHMHYISHLYGKTMKIIRLDRQLAEFYEMNPTAKDTIQSIGGIKIFCAIYGKLLINFMYSNDSITNNEISVIGAFNHTYHPNDIKPIRFDFSSILNHELILILHEYITCISPSTNEIKIEDVSSMYIKYPFLKDKLKIFGGLQQYISFNSIYFQSIEYVRSGKYNSTIRAIGTPIGKEWTNLSSTTVSNKTLDMHNNIGNINNNIGNINNNIGNIEATYTSPLDYSSLTFEQIKEATRLANLINCNKHIIKKDVMYTSTSEEEKESSIASNPSIIEHEQQNNNNNSSVSVSFEEECHVTSQKIIHFIKDYCIDCRMILPQDMIRLYEMHTDIKPIRVCGTM